MKLKKAKEILDILKIYCRTNFKEFFHCVECPFHTGKTGSFNGCKLIGPPKEFELTE